MQRIEVVNPDHVALGILEETGDQGLTVRLANGSAVQVAREQLEPLADGTLLLKTPADWRESADGGPPVVALQQVPVPRTPTRVEDANDAEAAARQTLMTIPRVEERLRIEKTARPEGAVRVHVIPTEQTKRVTVAVMQTQADVQRVQVGRIVDTAPAIREEGDTVIIPVLEEVLVVEKRLLLREEIHVVKQRTTHLEEREVSLRSEHVEISHERKDE